MFSDEFMDDLLGEIPCSLYAISTIENLLQTSSITEQEKKQIETDLVNLTESEANKIILHLAENNIPKDCREQFNQMFRRGVFN